MIGEGTALLETELGFPIPLLVSFSLFIYHSPLHHRMRFHPCTGRLESNRPVTSAPTLILIRIHTLGFGYIHGQWVPSQVLDIRRTALCTLREVAH